MDHLRHISLHVEEPEPGEFFWVLLESTFDSSVWTEVSAALHAEHTWNNAWSHGSIELMRCVPDRRIGPRAKGENEDDNPVG